MKGFLLLLFLFHYITSIFLRFEFSFNYVSDQENTKYTQNYKTIFENAIKIFIYLFPDFNIASKNTAA